MTPLTDSMVVALTRAARDGAVFAGRLYHTGRGSTVLGTPASVLRALERRGLVVLSIGPDGGMMAKLTDAGRVQALGVDS